MVNAGLKQIGFGIDGATAKVYKENRKPQTVQECLDAIKYSKEKYNLIPETLMVFGHNDIEDEFSLNKAYEFCKDMLEKYGAIPRPHIAKDIVPGNQGWLDYKNQKRREMFYKNPILFQNLDFTAVPSPITHSNAEFRNLVKKYYKKVCELPISLTNYVLAELPDLDEKEIKEIKNFNKGKYDI